MEKRLQFGDDHRPDGLISLWECEFGVGRAFAHTAAFVVGEQLPAVVGVEGCAPVSLVAIGIVRGAIETAAKLPV